MGAPTTTPGARYAYTGTDYWLLGNLIESVGGRPLAQALRADLLDPAGLARVAVQDAEALTPPISKPEAETPGTALPAPGPYIPTRAIASATGAAGAMAGDAASAARWGYLLSGGLLVPPESLKEMTDFADDDGYGLGTAQMDVAGHSAVGHIGETEGYRSVLVVIPQRRLSVAVLTASTTQTAPLAPLLLRAGQLIR